MAGNTGVPLNLVKPEMADLISATIPALASNAQAINDGPGKLLVRRTGTTADRWYPAGLVAAVAMTTGAPTANILRAMPLIVGKVTLDGIAINVTTLTAGNARLGIYNDDGNVYPGSRILDAGAVDTGSAGVKAIGINQALQPGLYWLVIVSNAASTIRALSLTACMPILGVDNTLSVTPGVGWSVAFNYAALPATFPSAAAAIVAIPIPAIFVRASA